MYVPCDYSRDVLVESTVEHERVGPRSVANDMCLTVHGKGES